MDVKNITMYMVELQLQATRDNTAGGFDVRRQGKSRCWRVAVVGISCCRVGAVTVLILLSVLESRLAGKCN